MYMIERRYGPGNRDYLYTYGPGDKAHAGLPLSAP